MSDEKLALKATGVCLSYGKGETRSEVLKAFDLSIKAGEFVALMGPSGSGKSTFLHLAAGLLLPTAGRIEVGGQDVTAMGDEAATKFRRRHEGVVFQAFNLVETLSVRENIALPVRLDHGRTDAARRAAARRDRARPLREAGRDPGGRADGQPRREGVARDLRASARPERDGAQRDPARHARPDGRGGGDARLLPQGREGRGGLRDGTRPGGDLEALSRNVRVIAAGRRECGDLSGQSTRTARRSRDRTLTRSVRRRPRRRSRRPSRPPRSPSRCGGRRTSETTRREAARVVRRR